MTIDQLHTMVSEVCPIIGLNSDGVVWFSTDATEEQKAAAIAIVNELVLSLETSI